MKFYRSVAAIILIITTWLILSFGSSEVLALERQQLSPDVSPAQSYATELVPLRSRFLELESLIEGQRWSEVQSFVRGPLGDFEIRLNFLVNSFSASERRAANRKVDRISNALYQLDSAATAGKLQPSLEGFQVLVEDFDGLLNLAGVGDISLLAEAPTQNTKNRNIVPQIIAQQTPLINSKDIAKGNQKDYQSKNDSIKYILGEGQTIMDANSSPDLTFIVLVLLIPLMIYLQIYYQHKHQADQDRVADLEGEIESLTKDIEALTNDKEKLGNSLEETQGQLVTLFMDLEQTKPLARLRHQRAVTVEEQEELIQQNDSFVKALLEQGQEQVSSADN